MRIGKGSENEHQQWRCLPQGREAPLLGYHQVSKLDLYSPTSYRCEARVTLYKRLQLNG